jgi:hypothetical protein
MRRVELPGNLNGHLFLHSMPGRYEPFEEFLTDIVFKNIRCVVCLSSPEEIRRRSDRRGPEPNFSKMESATAALWRPQRVALSTSCARVNG